VGEEKIMDKLKQSIDNYISQMATKRSEKINALVSEFKLFVGESFDSSKVIMNCGASGETIFYYDKYAAFRVSNWVEGSKPFDYVLNVTKYWKGETLK
jgi:hypothetical protein